MRVSITRALAVTAAAVFAVGAGTAADATPTIAGLENSQVKLVRPVADGDRNEGAGIMIVGGSTVSGSVPYIAALHTSGRFTCTASIIAAQWVLTAKHCVDQPSLTVRIGSTKRSSGGTMANVAQVVKGPGNNDIALLKLDKSVQASYVKVSTGSLSVGQSERVYGWGYTSSNWTNLAETLKTSSGQITQLNCATNFGDIACLRNNGDTAGGDSGGPMINSSGELIGVCSIGNKPTDGSGFGGYQTAVSSTIRGWIRNTAGV